MPPDLRSIINVNDPPRRLSDTDVACSTQTNRLIPATTKQYTSTLDGRVKLRRILEARLPACGQATTEAHIIIQQHNEL